MVCTALSFGKSNRARRFYCKARSRLRTVWLPLEAVGRGSRYSVGDAVEVHSSSAGGWCKGSVVEVKSGRVRVKYTAKGQEMQKDLTDAMLKSNYPPQSSMEQH